jgi:hypothetical protein
VARTLVLVTTSDVDHGCSVEGCTRAGSDTDADTGATNGLRRSRVATDWSTVTVGSGRRRSRVLVGGRATVEACTRLYGEAWVDHGHQSTDRCSWVAIDVADRSVKVELQLVNEIGGNVCLGKSGHVAKLLGRIVRHQCLHLDILGINAQTIGDTLGQECEDLADGSRAASDEAVVQSIVETNLHKSAVRGLLRHATRRLNQARHVGREAGRRGRGRTVRSQGAALLIGISGCRRRGGCCRREGELGWDLDSSRIVGTSRNDAVRSFSACRGRRRRSHGCRLCLGRNGDRNNGGC